MAPFYGRSRELGRLRGLLDTPEPTVVRVVGLRGVGKSALVRRAVDGLPASIHALPPLPDPALRAAVGQDADSSWLDILVALQGRATDAGRPFVLVLDDAHRLTEARSRFTKALVAAMARRPDPGGAPLHVVLVGPEGGMPPEADFAPLPVETLKLDPLPFRSAVRLLPGARPTERALAYAVFGGIPRVLGRLDPSLTVGTNVRRLALDPEGALADAGGAWLERDLQTPARYYAIARVLASGEADWSALHAGTADLTRSGQVAPYVQRLVELGLVESRRSLDASPRGRSSRYALTDPFLAFWFRFVLPYRFSASTESENAYYARVIRPALDDHMAGVFSSMCRQHMAHDAIETVGANAREVGGLWGPGYDLPVAGLLTSGAAYYGSCSWRPLRPDASPVEEIARTMRETRYGFGRERRLRLVFTGEEPPSWLRRDVARHADAELIDLEALAGD